MAKCAICDKGVHFGKQVSHSHRKSSKMWKPNIRKVKVVQDGRVQKVNVCSKCLRSDKVQRAV